MSDGQHSALAVPSRRRLLDALRAANVPMDGARLAEAVGLHLTTTRFHLDVLQRAGLVSRTVEHGGRPGRPRQLFRVVAEVDEIDSYRQLTEVLASALVTGSGDAAQRAEEAGRRWAERQVFAENLSWDEASRRVATLFDQLGFAPRLVDDHQGRHVELTACPFRDAARSYPHVVCSAHAGLLRNALARLNQPDAEEAQLRPFVGAELCIADLPGADDDPTTNPRPKSPRASGRDH